MSDLAIQLPLYEGPFEPLVALIRRDQYSVADIPIAEIVRQFGTYIERAEELDIDLGAEFVEAASWLIYLKSLLLLPKTDV
ncbi:MAG: segregation/condensation protein A, partial [Candidatus Sulfotelmatobacter sp.]